MIKNSKGNVYYGMHFYPGLAEYREPGEDPYRVYLNEDTLRKMDPTFAGRPIFVEHVDEVDQSLSELRKEADGWVIESFYNSSDGKHWVKFIVVSDRAERAIKNGFRLSNAYVPKSFGQGGIWNGIEYSKEITDGEFEHLAIVSNPRYDESEIKTPEQFKKYNEDNTVELRRIANSQELNDFSESDHPRAQDGKFGSGGGGGGSAGDSSADEEDTKKKHTAFSEKLDRLKKRFEEKKKKGLSEEEQGVWSTEIAKLEKSAKGAMSDLVAIGKKKNKEGIKMKLNFFKRQKVENSIDLEATLVVLPKSKKEYSIEALVNAMDEVEEKKKDMNNGLADMDHKVKMHDGSYCNVGELVEKHKSMCDEMEKMKKDSAEKEMDLKVEASPVDVEGDLANVEDDEAPAMDKDKKENEEEDKDAKKKALQLEENDEKEVEAAKKKNAKEKAERLKNAHLKTFQNDETASIDLSYDQVARGRSRYGS